jgi:hypothetical protein
VEKLTGFGGVDGAAERRFIETLREMKDLSTVLKVFLVRGAGNNANVGGGESGELLVGGGGWDRASDSERTRKAEP